MTDQLELRKIVGQVAAAYFANSHVTATDIPMVINQIAGSIAAVGANAAAAPADAPQQTRLTSAQIRRSVTHDAIISFEDSKPYKTMRRHLASRGLTPDAYRSKWGLPPDYPMVAPGYSEARSSMAKARGLGGRTRGAAQAATPVAAPKARSARRTSGRAAAASAAPPPTVQAAEPKAEAAVRRRAPGRPRRTGKRTD